MIAVDTNVIVRFLVCDDEKQAEKARQFLIRAEKNRERICIPLLVVLETILVLESAYNKTREEILDAIREMRHMSVITFESDDVIAQLLVHGNTYRADLSDILIAYTAQSAGCEKGVTFDKVATELPFFSRCE